MIEKPSNLICHHDFGLVLFKNSKKPIALSLMNDSVDLSLEKAMLLREKLTQMIIYIETIRERPKHL